LKSAKIIDPNSKFNNEIMDIYIKDGKIDKIAKSINSKEKLISKNSDVEFTAKNLHISPGWFDLHANFGEPGFEQNETINTGCNAAIKGGYTGVMLMPNNIPSIDNRSMIDFIKNKTINSIVDVLPAGNITKNSVGDSIVEMHDMADGGCKAFTDDKNSLIRNDVMKVAMLYSIDCNALIMNYPNDISLSKNGMMHEGKTSTMLGLKGIPNMAEAMMVDRDINLLEYTNSRLHLSYISTKDSAKKIKIAKKKGLSITADVSIYNLFLTDDYINNFDTRYKVLPPLREKEDNNALIKALKDNTIDVISSDHTPISDENKKIEFDNALYGIIGLESAFGLLCNHITPKIGLSLLIEKISINPRKVLQLPQVSINIGNNANITLFDPKKEWEFTIDDIKSKSLNTPFLGTKMIGKALGIINNGKIKIN
jgi:dihydroorotase